MILRGMRNFHVLILSVFKATVTVVDIDSGAEEKITVSSQGSAAGLNLKENQRIYFGGLPSIGNYRYNHSGFYTTSQHDTEGQSCF